MSAPHPPTDPIVEACAEALSNVVSSMAWADHAEEWREDCRAQARAVLRLAWSVEPTEEMIQKAEDCDFRGDGYDDIFKAMQSTLLRGVLKEGDDR